MKGKKVNKTLLICTGGLFIALFAVASNVPGLSAITFIPGVPITIQNFLIAMMALTLGMKGGLITLTSLLALTFFGLPLMSNGRGGPAVFVGPTSGYIWGWFLFIVILGLYKDKLMDKTLKNKTFGLSLHIPISFALGMTAVIVDYFCGSVGVVLSSGTGLSSLWPVFISNAAYLIGDTIKIVAASFLSQALACIPAFNRIMREINN